MKVGEINSYASAPAFAEPYRKGWRLALSMVNDLGGIDGRKLEFISRDDGGKPEDAVRLATELVTDAKVDLLAGGYLSAVGLALSAYALEAKRLYVAGAPLADALTWSKGNRYTYRIRPSTYMQAAMLVAEAAKLPAKRWVTVAPDDEYGRSAVSWFRQLLTARRPDVTFVAEQWPVPGQIDAGATVNALGQPGPDAVFNALFGSDLAAFVKQGNTGGLFGKRAVVSLLTGEPEYLDLLGGNTPPGWIVTGYPWGVSDEPDNKQFVLDYESAYHEHPTMGAVIGYAMVNAIASGVAKSGGTDAEKMADGFAGRYLHHPVRHLPVPPDRPPIHPWHLRRAPGRAGRPRRHGGLALRGRCERHAVRRRGPPLAPRCRVRVRADRPICSSFSDMDA